jgi:peptidoglycan/LPS O-acetylase OafA/YrhL
MCAIYTDVFLMLSGVLVAYAMTKRLKNNQPIKMAQEIFGRYIRVMPNMIVTMMVTIYLIPRLAENSPQKVLVVETPAELCKNFGWRNLL